MIATTRHYVRSNVVSRDVAKCLSHQRHRRAISHNVAGDINYCPLLSPWRYPKTLK